MTPSSPLTKAIADAARKAISALFSKHRERFYYLSLITSGEAHAPVIAAWSEEALERAVEGALDKEDMRWGLKWSYADSPYFCFGEEHFAVVNAMFAARPDIRGLCGLESQREYDYRLDAMEEALACLDSEGLFGTGDERLRIVINAEVMPPDFTNTARAKRLNPAKAIETWLKEAAE